MIRTLNRISEINFLLRIFSIYISTLTEVFLCFFLSCKANARVKLAKTGHGPCSSTLVCICVVQLLFVLFYVLFVCKCVLPPGDNPVAVNKYIISNNLFCSCQKIKVRWAWCFQARWSLRHVHQRRSSLQICSSYYGQNLVYHYQRPYPVSDIHFSSLWSSLHEVTGHGQ